MNPARLIARSSIVNGLVLSLVSGVLVLAAVRSDGYHATNVELGDGAVWVFRDDKGWIAKANSQTAEVESAFNIPRAQLVQDGNSVLSLSTNGLQRIDVTNGKATNAVPMPGPMSLGAHRGTGFLLNNATGELWVAPSQQLLGWSAEIEPVVTASPGSKAVVTTEGIVLIVDLLANEYSEIALDDDGLAQVEQSGLFADDLPTADDWELTAVGGRPVALIGQFMVAQGGRPVDLSDLGDDLALQEVGPADGGAVVASGQHLFEVDFDGGRSELYALGTGLPARPMLSDGCVTAAWGGTPWYVQRCRNSVVGEGKVPDVPSGVPFEFRLNGDALALSGPGTHHYIVRDGLLWPIKNWDQADPDQQSDDDDEDRSLVEQDDQLDRTCETTPAAPTGPNDPLEFGTHIGQTILLDVLNYFSDVNCDPLAVVAATVQGAPGDAVSIVNFGQAIQFRAPGAAGTVTIEFVVDDGRRANQVTGTAVVTVADGTNREPRLKRDRQARTAVQVGKTVSYNVLADWVDDDGDVLVLQSAVVGEGQGRVIPSPDGLVTYTAENTSAGVRVVDYSLTDGTHLETGRLEIVVQPEGTQMRPVARDDYAAGQVNQAIKLLPLLNDTDANNDPLTATPLLAAVDPALAVDASGSDQSFVFTATNPGTYVVPYQVTDTSDLSSIASIRLEIAAAESENRPPVAVRDSVVVREGRSANVDVLVNDTDADGDLLAVVDARLAPDVAATGAVRVVVIDRHFVRVEVKRDPGVPIVVTYLINDGRSHNVEGAMVVTVPRADQNLYPIITDDHAAVRVDEVLSLDVLANDRDPDGDQLFFIPAVDGSSPIRVTSGDGIAWLDGTRLRFKAGSTPSGARPVVITYQVDDDPTLVGLHRSTGTVYIDVRDDKANMPPVPQPLALRVFTKSRGSVAVPLSGIDANGDTALLHGDLLSQPSALGTAAVVGNTVVFEAGENPGTGVIEYVVSDRFGYEGIGVVRVVVVQGDPFPPVPIDDVLRVRGGRDVQVNVLANDTDPNGDDLKVEPDVRSSDPALVASVNTDGKRVNLTIPPVTEATTYSVTYWVTDGKGGRAAASIKIEADPDALLQAPILRDDPDAESPMDVYEAKDSSGRSVKVTDIEVIHNDDDPDGSREALAVQIAPGQGIEDGSGLKDVKPLKPGWLRVVMRDEPQWVVYTATDGEANTSSAVMLIESERNRGPDCPAGPIATAVAGQGPITIRISEVVTDPDRDRVQMEGADIVITPSDGEVQQSKGNFDSFTYQANPLTTLQRVVAAVRVEDRPGEDDSIAVTCFLEITVDRENDPPVTTESNFDVEQSEVLVDLDLKAYVEDPDGDVLQFRLPQGGSELTQEGVTLMLSENGAGTLQGDKALPGASPVFTYEVWDGEATSEWIEGRLRVNVVPTTKAPPTVVSKDFIDVPEAQPHSWDVSTGSFNPFDTPLEYAVDPMLLEGLGTVALSGSFVTFTPATGFVGRAVVRFTAKDEVEREALGTLTYTVIGKPLAPGKPTITEVSSHRVVMNWSAADPRGTPITDYIVRWPGGEYHTDGANSATIDGLPNNVSVSFTVTAENKQGEGPAGVASNPVMPDEVPSKPLKPTIDADVNNGQLSVAWLAPSVDGSPIIEYRLSISTGGTVTLPASQTSYDWGSLTNGTPYSFAVVAVNSAGASERSDFSDPQSPATVPGAPLGLSASDSGSAIECRVQLAWTKPAENGRPIVGYEIQVDSAAPITTYAMNPATSQNFAVGCGSHTYKVRAINAEGPSGWSNTATVTSPKAPGAPTLTSASSNSDRAIPIVITWPADNGGCALVKFQYSTSTGSPGSTWADVPGGLKSSGSSYTLSAQSTGAAFNNGTSYNVIVRAVNCKASVPSSSSNQRAATPSGAPINSGISISGSVSGTTITWSWNTAGAYNGSSLSVTVSGAGVSSNAGSGSTSRDYGYSSTQTLTVQVCDAVGRCTSKALTRTTAAPPQPTVSVSTGGTGANSKGTKPCVGCYWINVTLTNFTPNTTYVVSSTISGTVTKSVTTDSSGYAFVGDGYWYCGNPYNATASAGGYTSSTYVCQ